MAWQTRTPAEAQTAVQNGSNIRTRHSLRWLGVAIVICTAALTAAAITWALVALL